METQTTYKVAASFLKQIAWPPEEDRPYLKVLYDAININKDRPSQEAIVNLFKQCAQQIKVRVLFDALDECSERELGKVYKLIKSFCEANIGVYVTTRPHLVPRIRQWNDNFAEPTYLDNVKANESDIQTFIKREIQDHGNPIDNDLREEILNAIGDAQGMYHLVD